jgi:hypothetical protein
MNKTLKSIKNYSKYPKYQGATTQPNIIYEAIYKRFSKESSRD